MLGRVSKHRESSVSVPLKNGRMRVHSRALRVWSMSANVVTGSNTAMEGAQSKGGRRSKHHSELRLAFNINCVL